MKFRSFVDSLNAVNANVWAIAIITFGVVLLCCQDNGAGATLLTGGFALFRQSYDKPKAPEATNEAPKP